jgi:L-alanine-DL-glutamate epimerase-like enolase superfamily enzyme
VPGQGDDWGGEFGRYFGENHRGRRSIKGHHTPKAAVECAAGDLAGRRGGLPVNRRLGVPCAGASRSPFRIGLIDPGEAERETM